MAAIETVRDDELIRFKAGLLHLIKSGHHLSVQHLSILFVVYTETQEFTVRGMAALLGLDKPSVTRALDSMGHAGLVERLPDPADKRSILIGRTARGAAFVLAFVDVLRRGL